MSESILSVRDLQISFNTYAGTVQAVRGISFDLLQGETLAIVGESGSGKSVTTKAILGILPANAVLGSGSILYRNQDLTKIDEEAFHHIRGKQISLVFQDPLSALNPIMRIGKQIMEALTLSAGMKRDQARMEAIKLLGAVGISDPHRRIHQYPFEFSGGMRQRIVIAIALASNPELLICDEPTTALDVTIQAQILELIGDIKKERGLSIILITHDLGVVANMADRVAVMYAGRIVETGTSEEIFYDPRHPYTWALLSSMPDLETKEELFAIPGTPPNMLFPPPGDAFHQRNKFALKIDTREAPPFFSISPTHQVASWLMDPRAPKAQMPGALRHRIDRMKARAAYAQ
ncbi:MAG: ABC transporter ATP-binding protein [Christensenellales bacterium]|jgi:oligopeptide transport system ATP-binding protein